MQEAGCGKHLKNSKQVLLKLTEHGSIKGSFSRICSDLYPRLKRFQSCQFLHGFFCHFHLLGLNLWGIVLPQANFCALTFLNRVCIIIIKVCNFIIFVYTDSKPQTSALTFWLPHQSMRVPRLQSWAVKSGKRVYSLGHVEGFVERGKHEDAINFSELMGQWSPQGSLWIRFSRSSLPL